MGVTLCVRSQCITPITLTPTSPTTSHGYLLRSEIIRCMGFPIGGRTFTYCDASHAPENPDQLESIGKPSWVYSYNFGKFYCNRMSSLRDPMWHTHTNTSIFISIKINMLLFIVLYIRQLWLILLHMLMQYSLQLVNTLCICWQLRQYSCDLSQWIKKKKTWWWWNDYGSLPFAVFSIIYCINTCSFSIV